jgi:hypothetical protein
MPLPLGFVPPCLPTKTPQPPTGNVWLKHDGSRLVATACGSTAGRGTTSHID